MWQKKGIQTDYFGGDAFLHAPGVPPVGKAVKVEVLRRVKKYVGVKLPLWKEFKRTFVLF